MTVRPVTERAVLVERLANNAQLRKGRCGRRRYTTLLDGAKAYAVLCHSAVAQLFGTTKSIWRRQLRHRRP